MEELDSKHIRAVNLSRVAEDHDSDCFEVNGRSNKVVYRRHTIVQNGLESNSLKWRTVFVFEGPVLVKAGEHCAIKGTLNHRIDEYRTPNPGQKAGRLCYCWI